MDLCSGTKKVLRRRAVITLGCHNDKQRVMGAPFLCGQQMVSEPLKGRSSRL